MQTETVSKEVNSQIPGQAYTSECGLRFKNVGGEQMVAIEDVQNLMIEQVGKLTSQTTPMVTAAKGARDTINELLFGIGEDMSKFKENTAMYLNDIRQSRFAVVGETAAITKELKEIRQFFLGSDHKEQITRLTEFVSLCERLKALKDSGFLDCVADTMIRLA